MATKTTIELEGDLEGGPGDETLQFSLVGAEYEIDLNAKNASPFRRQLAPVIVRSRCSTFSHNYASTCSLTDSASILAWTSSSASPTNSSTKRLPDIVAWTIAE